MHDCLLLAAVVEVVPSGVVWSVPRYFAMELGGVSRVCCLFEHRSLSLAVCCHQGERSMGREGKGRAEIGTEAS